MRELGYAEGKNLEVEWRFAHGKNELLAGLAAELVKRKVDVIVSNSPQAIRAAQKATATIPIVMTSVSDPVGSGFVQSLAHPGGNITGLSTISDDLGPKQLEMLLSIAPKLSRVAVLANPDSPGNIKALTNLQAAARRTGLIILPVNARVPQEIEDAYSQMAREKAGGLIILRDSIFNQQRRQIAELAAKHRLPTIASLREYVETGVLMSYGSSVSEQYRRAATFVDKIFKGAKPAELPVEQPTKLELFINGKTAKLLGLKIPPSLLASADKVIEQDHE
jgi:putative ABC transport system substrate-binding protein